MSCHSTHGNKGAINLAAKATGLRNKDVEEVFHDLKREAKTVDDKTATAPTVDDWERFLHKQRQLTGILLEDDPAGQRIVSSYIDGAYRETPPDRETFYAQQHLVAETRRRQIAAQRAANGTAGYTMADLRENDWNREQAERAGMDPDQGGPAGLMTDEMEAYEFADPIGSGRYLSCGCRADSGCGYAYGGDCNKMLAAEYDDPDPEPEPEPQPTTTGQSERVSKFLSAHAHENGAAALRAHGGEHGVLSDRHGPVLSLDDLRRGDPFRLSAFVRAHEGESDSLPIAAHGTDKGLLSDSNGPLLTLGELRAQAARADAELAADSEGTDWSWTSESMDEQAQAMSGPAPSTWDTDPPF